ncbi:MAG: D-alanyl-D-alanine carboxypeptidase [Candidatus Gastranaerophilales bacterium]|nr:D-alanyl-D-alanine carboxypeptidase [Candidatus Gastranaerophilales bacterium]
MSLRKKIAALALTLFLVTLNILSGGSYALAAEIAVSAPSVILVEASTGQVIYEDHSTDRRSPASITKIMTLLLTFEKLAEGRIKLDDQVFTSAYASSMGGSQVFLAEGETQSLETMIKCIVVSSGNDASVAVAEHIAGSEAAFVELMNKKAEELGMTETHFEDCCGLTDSDDHYSCARDVAIMSRELTTKYPEIFNYTQIWMEDIVHETRQGTSNFTLSSTNKLLKQYQWTTGLKTGSTSKAMFCISATASKDGIDLIAVVMGAPTGTDRFQDAQTLLSYGFSVSSLYIDENKDMLPPLAVEGGVEEQVSVQYLGEFRYLDTEGNQLSQVEKVIELPQSARAPIEQGAVAGYARYMLDGVEIGSMPLLYTQDVEKAGYRDYLQKVWSYFLL